MRPPSVVLVTHYFPAHGGGIELVAGQVARRLGAVSWPIDWFASRTDAVPEYPGVRTHPQRACNAAERLFGLPLPLWSPAALARLVRSVRAADVVHVHDAHYPSNFVAAMAALRRGKRLVVTQHVGFVPYRNPVLRVVLGLVNRIVGRLVLARANAVLFVSPVVRTYFEMLVGKRATFQDRPNGVDTTLFSPVTESRRAELRAALGLPSDRPVLLFVGRHVEKKGLDLVRALAAASPGWTWCLIGDGPIQPRSWRLPRVIALGRMSQQAIVDYYRAADVLVLPSVGEGFPLVVQEALACGLPVAVHSESGEAGGLDAQVAMIESVSGADAVGRWHRRLDALLNEPETKRVARRDACRRFAVERWSWESAVAAYERALAGG